MLEHATVYLNSPKEMIIHTNDDFRIKIINIDFPIAEDEYERKYSYNKKIILGHAIEILKKGIERNLTDIKEITKNINFKNNKIEIFKQKLKEYE